MQTCEDGIPAKGDVSTVVWQYLQSMPISETCCWWLNATGWLKTAGENDCGARITKATAAPMTSSTTTILIGAMTFALRGKTWPIGSLRFGTASKTGLFERQCEFLEEV